MEPTPDEVEEKEQMRDDLSGLLDKFTKMETQVRVHGLILQDLPKKKKEDDPFFSKYAEFNQQRESERQDMQKQMTRKKTLATKTARKDSTVEASQE